MMKSGTGEKSPRKKRPRRSSKSKTIPTDVDLLASGFAERKFEREYKICEIAEQVLKGLCKYKRLPHHDWAVSPAKQHAVDGSRCYDTSLLGIYLASPMRWYDDIYKNGLAAPSGYFVLEVVKRQPDGSLIVIAVRQGRGYSVKLALAIARPQVGNAWSLEWNGLPEEFKTPLSSAGVQPDDFYSFMITKKLVEATAPWYSPSPDPDNDDQSRQPPER